MLSSGMKCYHLELILSSESKCYHLELKLSSGTKFYHLGWNVIIWDEMLSSGMKCYHLELMLSSGTKFYHLGWNIIIWDKMLSSKANVIMVSSGANFIFWCYHVMLSSGMITPPFLFFLETSLTPKEGAAPQHESISYIVWCTYFSLVMTFIAVAWAATKHPVIDVLFNIPTTIVL